MQFGVKFTPEAEKQFLELPNNIKPLIQRAIKERLATDPLSYGKPLRFSYKGHRRIRVSHYRIIYRVEDQNVIVIIVNIDHRKDVYNT